MVTDGWADQPTTRLLELLWAAKNLPLGPCSMVQRRKFALETKLHGPEENICLWDRASWS